MKTQNTLSSLAANFFGVKNHSGAQAKTTEQSAECLIASAASGSTNAAHESASERPAIPGVEILGAQNWTVWREAIRQKGREKAISAQHLTLLNILRGLPAERGFAPLSPRNWTGGRMAWISLALALDQLSMTLSELAKIAKGGALMRPWQEARAQHVFGESLWIELSKNHDALAAIAGLAAKERQRIREIQSGWKGMQERGESLPPEARVSEAPQRGPKPVFSRPATVGAKGSDAKIREISSEPGAVEDPADAQGNGVRDARLAGGAHGL